MKPVSLTIYANLAFTFIIVFSTVIVTGCNNASSRVKKHDNSRLLFAYNKSVPVKKKIYLTFDDGPGEGTKNVLQIAEDEKVPATFFIIGEHAYASNMQTSILAKLKTSPYIELCNHGYTHAWHNHYDKFYQEPDSVVHDFDRTKDSIDFTNCIVRTPGRNIWRTGNLRKTDNENSICAADSLQKAGFTLVGWDLEWHYNKSCDVAITADSLLKRIDYFFKKNKTRMTDNLVLLAHDRMFRKSAGSTELRRLFQKLKLRKDFEILWISAYPDTTESLENQPQDKPLTMQ